MKIILLDKIQKLGEIGDVVEVSSGYARNFLIPKKKAMFASDENLKYVESKKQNWLQLQQMRWLKLREKLIQYLKLRFR